MTDESRGEVGGVGFYLGPGDSFFCGGVGVACELGGGNCVEGRGRGIEEPGPVGYVCWYWT